MMNDINKKPNKEDLIRRWEGQDTRLKKIIETLKRGDDWTVYLDKCEIDGVKYNELPFLESASTSGDSTTFPKDLRGVRIENEIFENIRMTSISFDHSDLSNLILKNCYCFHLYAPNAHIFKVTFVDCELAHSEFNNTEFIRCSFKNCSLFGAQFEDAYISQLDFSACDLRQSNFLNVEFKYTRFIDNQLSEDTNWGVRGNWYFFPLKGKMLSLENIAVKGNDPYDWIPEKYYKEAAVLYRNIKSEYKKCNLFSEASKFYYREMVCNRKSELERGYITYLVDLLFKDLLCGYGEKPFRILLVSCFVILFCSIGYLFFGIEYQLNGKTYVLKRFLTFDFSQLLPTLSDFIHSFYFSVVTFTTIGYGDYHPAGISKFIASGEALLGVFLTLLFAVTLTRVIVRD
jgi:hypothetical protein